MGMDKSATTEQILYHIMEMLYLLTGEDYIVVKKPGRQTTHNRLLVVEGISRTMANALPTPSRSATSRKETEQKILDLTNKITELLTGEVPIRCDDVTVHFSMEEWDYIEEHQDLYKDVSIKKHQNIELLDDPICKNSLLHNGSSGLLNEHDLMENRNIHRHGVMQNVSSANFTENISACEDGSISNVDHRNYSGMRIKEEACDDSYVGGNLPTPHSGVQFHSAHIKEEPASYDDHLANPTPMDHTPHPTVEEPSSYGEPQINTYTPTDHVQHHSYLHIVEQQFPYGETAPNMYTSNDHTPHHPSPHTAEEQPSHSGQSLLQPNVLAPADPSQYPFTHIIMNAVSRERGKQANTDHKKQYSSLDSTMEKPSSSNKASVSCKDLNLKTLSYPIRLSATTLVKQINPASSIEKRPENTVVSSAGSEPLQMDVDDEKSNSSVYSVRQSDNAMEILYHCPSCQKAFYSNLDLAKHQVIHSVDKLFVCSLCGKSFTELSFLVKHQVFHTDLKLCVCKVCGGCFYSESSLAKHEKTHSSPVHCFNCGKCFFSKTELEIHKRKHTLEKPYGCHVCGKHFITKYVHDKHMLCHTKVELSK